MKKLITLSFLLLFVAVAAGVALVTGAWTPAGPGGEPFDKLLYAQLDRLTQRVSMATGLGVVTNRLDATVGACIYAVATAENRLQEVPGQPFFFATPVRLDDKAPVRVLCRFVASAESFSFSGSPSVVFQIDREPGQPGLLEMVSGGGYLSSNALDLVLQEGDVRARLRSKDKAGIYVVKEEGRVSLFVQAGHLEAEVARSPGQSKNHVLRFVPMGAGTVTLPGTEALSEGKEIQALPSGVSVVEAEKVKAPAEPQAPAPGSAVPNKEASPPPFPLPSPPPPRAPNAR